MKRPNQVSEMVTFWVCECCHKRFLTEPLAARCIERHERSEKHRKARSEIPARNAAIVKRVDGGETMASIARELCISRQRVRSIVEKQKRQELNFQKWLLENPSRPVDPFYRLSSRSANCLRAEGLHSLEDVRRFVAEHGEAELRKIPNFGKVSMLEVQEMLASHQAGSECK